MMTPAELFLEFLKPDGKPDRQLKQYEALRIMFNNPMDNYVMDGMRPGNTWVNHWGVTMMFPDGSPGAMPHITPENKVCPDITKWRETCHAPDLRANCSEGWDAVRKKQEEIRQSGYLATILMGTGIFEQCHFLMGFEDTLVALMEHPDEMHELIDYILEYRMEYAKMVVEYLHPDVILSHDDWGTKHALFMQPDIWREFFKEPYRKFYGYLRENGIIVIHHADSFLADIIEDMAEIGIQCWQGVLPENNIPALQERLQGRMTLMGGVGAAIDREDASEEEIRNYVNDVLYRNCARGHFIPSITYGAPGTVFPHVDQVIDATISEYNQVLHVPSFRPVNPAARTIAKEAEVTNTETKETENQTSLLDQISSALQKGKVKRTVSLSTQALNSGIPAQTILSDGLVAGMSELGEAFSAGRVFVPEMLMAAKCMTAATEILKPHLSSGASGTSGRVCIGTVKGDLHDIGKNLVKIMMEGSGLEVIDLGTDVSAESFVSTAKNESCDIIACSSLLTTTMGEMRRVVELCCSEGIRDKVTIMIGGAPISQEFCNEIGADIYTVDAASAARAAVHALSN